jgi:hypothetical protein
MDAMTDESEYLWDPRSRVVDPQAAALENALQQFRFEPTTPLRFWRAPRHGHVSVRRRCGRVADRRRATLLVRPAKWSVRLKAA